MTTKKLSARDFGSFKTPAPETPEIPATPGPDLPHEAPGDQVDTQHVRLDETPPQDPGPGERETPEPAKTPAKTPAKPPAKSLAKSRGKEARRADRPSSTDVTARRRLRGQAACESTALGALASLRHLEEEMRTLAVALRESNPATLRQAKTWKKKSRRKMKATTEAQAMLERFRASKPQPQATSALRLLLDNCGSGCMGCPHPEWAVWTLVPNKQAPEKPARRTLVKLTGRAALDNHAYGQARAAEAGGALAPSDPQDRTAAKAAQLVRLRVLAYARKSPDPNTLALVKRILQVIDTRRKVLDVLSQLGRLTRTRRP